MVLRPSKIWIPIIFRLLEVLKNFIIRPARIAKCNPSVIISLVASGIDQVVQY